LAEDGGIHDVHLSKDLVKRQKAERLVVFCGLFMVHNCMDGGVNIFVTQHDRFGNPRGPAGIQNSGRVRSFGVHCLKDALGSRKRTFPSFSPDSYFVLLLHHRRDQKGNLGKDRQ
jgi:hypothetical protein